MATLTKIIKFHPETLEALAGIENILRDVLKAQLEIDTMLRGDIRFLMEEFKAMLRLEAAVEETELDDGTEERVRIRFPDAA